MRRASLAALLAVTILLTTSLGSAQAAYYTATFVLFDPDGVWYLGPGVDPYDYVDCWWNGPSFITIGIIPIPCKEFRFAMWAEYRVSPWAYPGWVFSSGKSSGEWEQDAQNAPEECYYSGGAVWDYGYWWLTITSKPIEFRFWVGPD